MMLTPDELKELRDDLYFWIPSDSAGRHSLDQLIIEAEKVIRGPMISFTVIGTPIPQGSMVKGKFGGVHSANKNLDQWRHLIAEKTATQVTVWELEEPLWSPLAVDLVFWFNRPKSHWATNGLSRKAPSNHTVKPDLDKLCRSVFDGLKEGGMILDDSLICKVHAEKKWTTGVQPVGVDINLVLLDM
jgi:Holliday junction resolvase RusA-like endonuclease